MAKIKRSVVISFDDDFSKKIAWRDVNYDYVARHADEILEKAMSAGAEAALPIVRAELQGAIGGDTKVQSRSTGELVDSLGISPVMVNNNGITNVKIGFSEPRRHQYAEKKKRSYYTVTNAMIANVLEYGKSGQPPRPWLKRAKTQATKVFTTSLTSACSTRIPQKQPRFQAPQA